MLATYGPEVSSDENPFTIIGDAIEALDRARRVHSDCGTCSCVAAVA